MPDLTHAIGRDGHVPIAAIGEAVDLSQPVYDGLATTGAHGTARVVITSYATCAARDISLTHVDMSAHMGTHVDAARHFFPAGRGIDEYDVAMFDGPGVVVDVEREGAVAVTADEIASADIRPDDVVLFCFGYGRHYGEDAYRTHPYLSEEVADLLADQGVRMVGVDTITPDLPAVARPPDFDVPVHRRLLDRDILIIENLGPRLVELRGCRVAVSALPLAIRGGDAGPARVTARRVA